MIPLVVSQGIYVIENKLDDIEYLTILDSSFWPIIQNAITINPPATLEYIENEGYFLDFDLLEQYVLSLFSYKESYPVSDDEGLVMDIILN